MKKRSKFAVFVISLIIAFFLCSLGGISSLFSYKNFGSDNYLYAAKKKKAKKKAAKKKKAKKKAAKKKKAKRKKAKKKGPPKKKAKKKKAKKKTI